MPQDAKPGPHLHGRTLDSLEQEAEEALAYNAESFDFDLSTAIEMHQEFGDKKTKRAIRVHAVAQFFAEDMPNLDANYKEFCVMLWELTEFITDKVEKNRMRSIFKKAASDRAKYLIAKQGHLFCEAV